MSVGKVSTITLSFTLRIIKRLDIASSLNEDEKGRNCFEKRFLKIKGWCSNDLKQKARCQWG